MTLTGPKQLSGQEKLRDVSQLVESLRVDINDRSLTEDDRFTKLEQLKVHGRIPQNADPIFTQETVELLCKYAFGDHVQKVAQEAMRCLANTFLLQRALIKPFVDLKYGEKAADRLEFQNDDDEFLVCRILFLATYGSSLDFHTLVYEHGLANSIAAHLDRHAKTLADRKQGDVAPPIEHLALCENLKLIYNITSQCPDLVASFGACIDALIDLTITTPIPEPPLQVPVSLLVNALSQLDLQGINSFERAETKVRSEEDISSYIDKLTTILGKATLQYSPADLESLAVPLVLLLWKIYEISPDPSRRHMRSTLLPSPTDRELPIGKSASLSSRLLQLTTNPVTPHLRESIFGMYYELSSKDPTTFIENIGYGYAAGYLMSHSIPVPGSSSAGGAQDDTPFNPVTGQRLDKESFVDSEPDMTQEEKEREAERLFVLFERLKATGVVDVKNPVEEAMKSGNRFEEVEDDSDND